MDLSHIFASPCHTRKSVSLFSNVVHKGGGVFYIEVSWSWLSPDARRLAHSLEDHHDLGRRVALELAIELKVIRSRLNQWQLRRQWNGFHLGAPGIINARDGIPLDQQRLAGFDFDRDLQRGGTIDLESGIHDRAAASENPELEL